MNTDHDFQADNKFFIDNYDTLLDLHAGKAVVIADNRVLHVADSELQAISWTYTFGIEGKCSVLTVDPDTYVLLTDGVCR